jgi:hypothetical protein
MKRISTIVALGFGCVAIAAAQTPPPQTSSSQQTGANRSSANTITVTGCLQRGDQAGAVGTTGTAGTPTATPSRSQSEAGNSASFILTNAKSGSSSDTNRPAAGSTAGAPPSTAGTTGSATAHPSATAGAKYILEPGSSQSELTSNVGKRVEVTGTLDTMSSSSPASATGAAGATSSASSSASEKIRVSSVRVIGSDCSSEQ